MTARLPLMLGSALLAGALALPTTAATAAPATAAPATAAARAAAPAAAGATTTDGCLTSVPDPGTDEPVEICWTLFRPAGADRRARVPMIMHSHGWGGSRETEASAFRDFLRRGYGVLSFDQRGFGESGGQAQVMDPAHEGVDVRRLVRMVAGLRWVQQDAPGDPRLGAIGGSYGGGYQFVGAFEELRTRGTPVFDALAPEITWHDLGQSLAPEDVVRVEWAAALGAAAVPTDALPAGVYQALVEGAVIGSWPDGDGPLGTDIAAFMRDNGPRYQVAQGRRLDIPVLLGQGTTDSLFPLEQGFRNWQRAITPAARRDSIFVGYNGGHVLPALFPRGIDVTSDPCSARLAGGDFRALSLRFFAEQLRGRDTGLRGYGRYHLATRDSTCTTVRTVAADRAVPIRTVRTPTVVGPQVTTLVAPGPVRVAGTPYLTGDVTTPTPGSRAFYGLAVGTSAADATLVQNNVLPLDEPAAVTDQRRRVDLPSVAVDVPRGQNLYLLSSPLSDTFVGMGGRVPGLVTIEDGVVHLPVVGR
ncbi:putative protein YcjY [Nocardioides aquaticus]|uniref:Xaa-Pro dipeptidyl-peptidase-like domain-containing protein n=1 Tax=Nocardioides aquaticus TaxID=160826 RepID=A0ABX8ELN4_9ACTN|nr:alpha/beta fold hydrolase [Nocardioides aquaticus]QVT81433.1 putative protein YcjY [Nocardioides aquaticus]